MDRISKGNRKCNAGVTMIELLVAMTIFAIVLVGILPLSLYTITSNRDNNRMMTARNLMSNMVEQLKVLPSNAAWRANDGDNSDTTDNIGGDHNVVQGMYGIRWNIVNNPDNSQIIHIFINWQNGTRGQQTVSSRFTLL
ncbi:MAG: prepilin-type N-terminal cleavage/methylation domain-containing protein [Candidatus Edwardsbacteria bacterium]|jgi:prepilin-type N-terminal cleavage/methylation domain-containing protein|nr:prepilin-type N-terminal cleavage/methylation domain-containing protein [Candidatus Edwardsbacteria bacterium]